MKRSSLTTIAILALMLSACTAMQRGGLIGGLIGGGMGAGIGAAGGGVGVSAKSRLEKATPKNANVKTRSVDLSKNLILISSLFDLVENTV